MEINKKKLTVASTWEWWREGWSSLCSKRFRTVQGQRNLGCAKEFFTFGLHPHFSRGPNVKNFLIQPKFCLPTGGGVGKKKRTPGMCLRNKKITQADDKTSTRCFKFSCTQAVKASNAVPLTLAGNTNSTQVNVNCNCLELVWKSYI